MIRQWTEEEDRWITENARLYRRKPKEMLRKLNELFGNERTERALAQRKYDICVHDDLYTEEQERWLMERFYLRRRDLVRLFNERFGECRGYWPLTNKMVRLGAIRNKSRKEVRQ